MEFYNVHFWEPYAKKNLLFCSFQLFPKLIQRQIYLGGGGNLHINNVHFGKWYTDSKLHEGKENFLVTFAQTQHPTWYRHTETHVSWTNKYLQGLCNTKSHIVLVIS